jgi:hypothetical protein
METGETWYGKCLVYKWISTYISDSIIIRERRMRSFLINKNLSFYYWLKKRIGKARALRVASTLEKVILVFGREQIRSRA